MLRGSEMPENQIEKIIVFPTVANIESVAGRGNLSLALTAPIGRDEAIDTVCELLRRPEIRLLTITGTGGVGKTCLGLQVASQIWSEFADGIFFIPLSTISDPDAILPLLAHTLELRESEEHSLFEHVKAFLRRKCVLILVDNFEQVLTGASLLVALLSACPALKILVTSRVVLRVQGEYEYALSALTLPREQQNSSYNEISQATAVELFVQRARHVQYDFQLTKENAATIAEICRQLDGLPLALELAAARIKLLSPQSLLARLNSRLTLLTGGGQDVPERQKTLRATMLWSYELLSAEEQALFRRFAVFVGGCQLEAVEALYAALDDFSFSVLDGIAQLIDKSLIQQHEQEGRDPWLSMLETVHEFAHELLVASGELERVQGAHASYYFSLARRAEPELYHHQQRTWLAQLEQDHANIRAALTFFHSHGLQAQLAHLVGSLGWFWYMHGFLYEGQQWTEAALAVGIEQLPQMVQGKIISGAGVFAGFLGQNELAFTRCQESLPLCKRSGDLRNLSASVYMLVHGLLAVGEGTAARSLAEETMAFVTAAQDSWAIGALHCMLGSVALYEGDYERAWRLHERGIALFDIEGDLCMNGLIRMMLADVAIAQGNEEKARTLIQQGIEMFGQVGASWSLGSYFMLWGQIALGRGHYARARFLLQEALGYLRQMGDQQGIVGAYALLARIAATEHEYQRARHLANECIRIAQSLKDIQGTINCLEGLADVVASHDEFLWATRMWGTIEQLYGMLGATLPESITSMRDPLIQQARATLGQALFASAWQEGREMAPERVLMSQDETSPAEHEESALAETESRSDASINLTKRERDVLRYLAQGMTNAQIAQQLVITPTTVNSYLRTIYSKLGAKSRTAAVRYTMDHHLL